MTHASPAGGPAARPVNNLSGAMWLVLSGLTFTVFLVLAKQLSETQTPAVLAFWRSFVGLLVTLPVVFQRGWGVLRITRPGLVMLRSLCGTVAFICSMFAISDLFSLPLSQFNAISFSRALFVTVLAAWLLRETVGLWRWGAVAVGFVGVLIMVLPGLVLPGYQSADGATGLVLDGGTLLALLSAAGFAGAIVMVKTLTSTHSPMTLLIWANLLSTLLLAAILGGASLLQANPEEAGLLGEFYFTRPEGAEWWLLIAMAVAGVGGQYCYIRAMSVGDASFLAPIDYLRLPMAALADWLIFKLLPDYPVWIGAGVIISATLFITFREHRKKAA